MHATLNTPRAPWLTVAHVASLSNARCPGSDGDADRGGGAGVGLQWGLMRTVTTMVTLLSAMQDPSVDQVYVAANITFHQPWAMQGVAVTVQKAVLGDRTACGTWSQSICRP